MFFVTYLVGVAGVLLLPQIDAGFLNSGKPYLDFVFPERPEDSGANWTPLRTIGEQVGMVFGVRPVRPVPRAAGVLLPADEIPVPLPNPLHHHPGVRGDPALLRTVCGY